MDTRFRAPLGAASLSARTCETPNQQGKKGGVEWVEWAWMRAYLRKVKTRGEEEGGSMNGPELFSLSPFAV